MSYLDLSNIGYGDTPSLDAFGNLRTSWPETLFSSKITRGKEENQIWTKSEVSGGTVAYNTNKSEMLLTVLTASGAKAIRQSKEYIHYNPGKSQKVLITGRMGAPKSNVRQRIGLFDESNGLFFEQTSSGFRDSIPKITKNNHIQHQPRYNMYRNKTKAEIDLKTISGFPLKALKHHEKKDPYGYTDGTFVGFMMDGTPCRIKMDTCNRLSNKPDRVWLKLDNYFKNTNFTSITSGPPDKYGFCSYDLPTAQSLFSFYSITKVFNGNYPIWANQFDIWAPNIKETFSNEYFSLCFSYCLFDNRCVTMQFEKDNPVLGVPEIFIDNPLCPTNSESFWSKTLDAQIKYPLAKDLVDEIKSLYEYWNIEYCKGQFIKNCGLEDEAYFKYFDYPDFITPYSGLIQIRKYAEKNGKTDIIERFDKIKIITKKVKESIYDLLVNEFKYFE